MPFLMRTQIMPQIDEIPLRLADDRLKILQFGVDNTDCEPDPRALSRHMLESALGWTNRNRAQT